MALSMILVTVIIYLLMTKLYRKFSFPLLLPILTSTAGIILLLTVLHFNYQAYMQGGHWINHLLGPAVVALAYPLYQEWTLIKKHLIPILCGVGMATLLAVFGMWGAASLLHIKRQLIMTLLPKSVTSPVALDVSQEIGGLPSLTVTFVMIAGITGAIFGPYIYRWLNIDHELGKGIGYGSASHAIGTSKALEDSATTGAVSSIAMILSAILTSIILPVMIYLF
ncbi:putative murein hydrolase (TIGR00659 family) [Pullulanibacillus pueri]|uniref:LrgB family protein n=1 Tax=Pullulanibacillus pueri TaxID=1437324 RepID=A0A8J2ZZG8_9BACL|nr:LrgB family protein [Pullulanibacillus pueri]MBM7684043.1 putative murein hydrolase (TIGR00659 family) [Pullulanibacillus pueri]GGH88474.1 hypothetical protein GCM10007096_40890 [Pullulanibacillus pueri]